MSDLTRRNGNICSGERRVNTPSIRTWVSPSSNSIVVVPSQVTVTASPGSVATMASGQPMSSISPLTWYMRQSSSASNNAMPAAAARPAKNQRRTRSSVTACRKVSRTLAIPAYCPAAILAMCAANGAR